MRLRDPAPSTGQDIQEMAACGRRCHHVRSPFLIGTLAISGSPRLLRFYSKDMILGAALEFA